MRTVLHGRVQDSGPATEEKQTIAMEYAQRVYDGEYDTAGESVRKANMPVHYKQ